MYLKTLFCALYSFFYLFICLFVRVFSEEPNAEAADEYAVRSSWYRYNRTPTPEFLGFAFTQCTHITNCYIKVPLWEKKFELMECLVLCEVSNCSSDPNVNESIGSKERCDAIA